MAKRVVPSRHYADNSSGSLPAVCTDWQDVRRFHVGTGIEPTSDAGYTTADAPLTANNTISLFTYGGSPYTKVRFQTYRQQVTRIQLIVLHSKVL
jgi:hypothetical protein